jgi:glutaredoxin-like protein NrdH
VTVTVYSKPACPQCLATRRAFDQARVHYQVIDLSQDAEALSEVISLGHRQAPVVVAGTDHWSGFRPDRIAAVAAQQAIKGADADHSPFALKAA